jgi:hypothetical protein
MIDHLSSKVCAATGWACITIQEELIKIAIFERVRMIASHTNYPQ